MDISPTKDSGATLDTSSEAGLPIKQSLPSVNLPAKEISQLVPTKRTLSTQISRNVVIVQKPRSGNTTLKMGLMEFHATKSAAHPQGVVSASSDSTQPLSEADLPPQKVSENLKSQTKTFPQDKNPSSGVPASGPSSATGPAGSLPRSWADKAKLGTDRSLEKLATPILSPEGIPQIRVPDAVFQRGAEAHKDYVIGVFTGKPPSYSQIQSVLAHIWGRGVKLQIHLRPASRSMLVKIPNDFVRAKIVEQEIWHIGTSLFYVAQWTAEVALKQPTFDSIPLWAHVRGVPFDLYTREGLSLVASLIGFPVEADEFTIKMVSLEVAHLKVRADCTKPMPTIVELLRDNGEVIPVSVEYPWLPPTCSCCKQLGHTEARCPNAKWAPTKDAPSGNKPQAKEQNKGKKASSSSNSPAKSVIGSDDLASTSTPSPPAMSSPTAQQTSSELVPAQLPSLPESATKTLSSHFDAPESTSLALAIQHPSSAAPVNLIFGSNDELVSSEGFSTVGFSTNQKSGPSYFNAKKRKNTNLSRRDSLSPPVSANPFACLANQLELLAPTELSADLLSASGTSAQSIILPDASEPPEPPVEGSNTPVMGSSLQDGKKSF